MFELFDFAGLPLFSGSLLMLLILGGILYFAFAKNAVALTAKRVVRIYLYFFTFLGIMITVTGLSAFFSGALGLALNVDSTPNPIPLFGEPRSGMPPMLDDSIDYRGKPLPIEYNDEQREIIYGMELFIFGLIITLVHYFGLKKIEKRDSLLRRLFAGAGMFIFALVLISVFMDLISHISYLAVSDRSNSSVVSSLSTLLAVLPAWALFTYIAYNSLKDELGIRNTKKKKSN